MKNKRKEETSGNLGFEETLWKAADKLRSNIDAAEYKHVVLGLIFLKYISDSFEEKRKELSKNPEAGLEDRDEYTAENVFWVPKKARWEYIQSNAKQPEIGAIINDAMDIIEKENPSLKGVLPKDYTKPGIDKTRLGELVDLIATIELGDKNNREKDIIGQVYEYFLGKFASAEGKNGGEFYTPKCIVKLLVEMLEPYKGRVYDPCCGSGGMFVQSEKFVEAHGGRLSDLSVYGQESNYTTWRLCKMNLAIRGIEEQIAYGDSFHNDKHKDLRADFILANPPFNSSDWKGENLREDPRWKYGVPPIGNANFAWVQHFIYHLSPTGAAGFLLANGSLSSNTSGEGEIRKNIVEANLVDCIIAMPGQLFYNTMIPVSIWFLAKDKKDNKFRDRRGEILFIDARKMGIMIDRRHRELTDEEIARIAATYHAWRGEKGKYKDTLGFCKAAKLEEVRNNKYILTPGRYVGAAEEVEDSEKFEDKVKKLTLELSQQFTESRRLEEEIKNNLKTIDYQIK